VAKQSAELAHNRRFAQRHDHDPDCGRQSSALVVVSDPQVGLPSFSAAPGRLIL
jgi:hypothetical protein